MPVTTPCGGSTSLFGFAGCPLTRDHVATIVEPLAFNWMVAEQLTCSGLEALVAEKCAVKPVWQAISQFGDDPEKCMGLLGQVPELRALLSIYFEPNVA